MIADRPKLFAEYTAELRVCQGRASSFRGFQDRTMPRLTVERAPQTAVEYRLDIGRRLTTLDGFHYPRTDRNVLQPLADKGVVLADLLPALLEMARVRNGMVRDYARIDDATRTISSRGNQTTPMASLRSSGHIWKGSESARRERRGSV